MRGEQSSSTVRWAMLVVAVLSLVAGGRALLPHAWRPLADISHLTLSAACLRDACDPYDAAALNQQTITRQEIRPHVWREAPIYPPSSLLVILPFAEVHWPTGALVFNLVSTIMFAAASLLLVWRLRVRFGPTLVILALPCVCYPVFFTLAFGNPALLTVSLAGLAGTLLLSPLSRAYALAWLPLGLALALKPQLIAGVVVILFVRVKSRSTAARAVAFSITLFFLACLAYRLRLGSFDFLTHLRNNLRLSLLPGASSDFSPANDESYDFLNLQAVLSRIPGISRSITETIAWSLTLGLALTAWLLTNHSRLAERMPWAMISLASLIGVMPVYHRGYDRVLALLLAPAALELAGLSKRFAWLYAALVCVWVSNDTVMAHILRRWRFTPQNPVEELILCAMLLTALWSARRKGPALEVDSIAR